MGFNSGFKGLIYYSNSAPHVSGDVFAHHLEHLTVFTVSGSLHPSRCRPKHVEQTWNNKLIYIVHLVGYFHSCITMHGFMKVKFTFVLFGGVRSIFYFRHSVNGTHCCFSVAIVRSFILLGSHV